MNSENNYHISFFKPTTDSARRNRNIIVQFVLIWAVAIFGFQVLLKIIEKPTPEASYLIFEEYWSQATGDSPSTVSRQAVGQSSLSVLGKIMIEPNHKNALSNAVSYMAYQIADSTEKLELVANMHDFEEASAQMQVFSDPSYVASKAKLNTQLRKLLLLDDGDVRGEIAALEVHSGMTREFSEENRKLTEEAMEVYLIHNQSVLTDTKFLGFPFHYFYTAVFLLVLFVGLCWMYCVRIDQFNKKYDIAD